MFDGKELLYTVRQLLQEGSTSIFLDDKSSYDFIYEAVCEFVSKTRLLTGEDTITSNATVSEYKLSPSFLALYAMNDYNEYVIKYYDNTSYYWPIYREYNAVWTANNTNQASVPNNFSIKDYSTSPSNVTGVCTATAALSVGIANLTASSSTFVTDEVSAGDSIHNTTDGSDGIVLSVTSEIVIKTALFNGTNDYWTTGDSFIITKQPRKELVIDPPSLTSGHTMTVPYIQKPDPVYTAYGAYRVPSQYMPAICKYAAWLYKYRDREPNFGDAWYKFWDMKLREANHNENRDPSRRVWRVNMRKTTMRDRSYR